MKVVVYAICKNEVAFVERWMASMSEADQVVVLDTGSTDGTVEKLRELGAKVEVEVISPWRFDVARNKALDLVDEDADICVCTDLDEVFHPGWRALLEKAWKPGTTQASYRYTWNFQPDGQEGVVFWIEKAHSRQGFRWKHPVHEVIAWVGPGQQGPKVVAEGIQIDHHADTTKPRAQYLPLLEMSVEEDPEDDRNMHYLGREYMFKGRWDDCIRTLKRHLALPSARWADERSASMRFIARSYWNKGQPTLARDWYLKAIAEAPHLREAMVDLARMLYDQKDWEGVLTFTGWALELKERPRSYICEADAWGSLPHDLRAIAYHRTGRIAEALAEAKLALEQSPENERLKGNVALLEKLAQA